MVSLTTSGLQAAALVGKQGFKKGRFFENVTYTCILRYKCNTIKEGFPRVDYLLKYVLSL